MLRKLTFALLAVAGMSLLGATSSEAAPVSAYNPYRSFNISGVNYGSMQWERTHRGGGSSWRGGAVHRGGLFFRRR